MKYTMKWLLSAVFCIGIITTQVNASDDTLAPLPDDPATDTSLLSDMPPAPTSDIAQDLSAAHSNADVINDPITSLDDLADIPTTPKEVDSSLPIDLPIFGTIYLYPTTENGVSGMATYLPNKNKQLVIGPLTIERSQFKLINNKLTYQAQATLFGSKGTISLSTEQSKETKPTLKNKKRYSVITFDLHFDTAPSIDVIINDEKAELSNISLVLNKNDKKTPIKITAQTILFNQKVTVTIGIGEKVTSMWAELPDQKLITLIPDVQDTPLQDSIISKLKITLKNVTSKDNKPVRFILDGEIEAPKIEGLETTQDSAKQLAIRAVFDKDNGGFLTTSASQLIIPAVGTIKNASFSANFPRKNTASVTKKTTKALSKNKQKVPQNSFYATGDLEVTIPNIGTFDTTINARLTKKGFVFASTLKQTVSIGDIQINPVVMSYSSITKTLKLSGQATIQGYKTTVEISNTTNKKGITTTSIQAQLDDKTLKPFDNIPLPSLLQKITFDNPHFTFNQKGKTYDVALEGTVTIAGVPLKSSIDIKQNKGSTIKLINIQAPKNFTFSSVFPELKSTSFNDLTLENAVLIISTDDYLDTTNKVTYKKGLNIIGNATVTGPSLQKAAEFAHSPGTIFVAAYIASDPIHSSLHIKMSDGFAIPNNSQVSFGPLYLELEGTNPSFALKGTLYVKPSPQDDQLTFDARISFNALGASVAGTMSGVWQHPFGIQNLIIGSNDPQVPVKGVAAEITMIPGPEPVESLGLAGALKIGTIFAAMGVKVGPEPVLYGELNALTMIDVANMMQDTIGKKISGVDKLPLKDFSIRDGKIYLVPHETKIGEFEFEQGLTLRGLINFPGLTAYGNIVVSSSKGLLAQAYCSPIIIGSIKNPLLKISKADSDTTIRKGPIALQPDSSLNTDPAVAIKIPDPSKPQMQNLADTFKNGPMMFINIPIPSIPLILPEIKVSGQFEITDVISDSTDLHISQDGISFTFITTLGKSMYVDKNQKKQSLLQSTVIGTTSGSLVSNPNFTIDLIFQNSLQDYIMQRVTRGITDAKNQVSSGIAAAKKEADQKLIAAQGSVTSSQTSTTAALTAANDQAQKDLQDAQNTVDTLQKRIDELNASIDRHKKACDVLHPLDCAWILADGSELATKVTAKETATGALKLAQDVAKQTLSAVNSATQTATGSASTFLGGLNQISQGTLIVAQGGTNGILTAVDQATQKIVGSFNIQHITYHGDLQTLATGKLGNVSCTAQILSQPIDFSFMLDVHDATNSINNLINAIVDTMKKKIQNMIIVA